MKEMIERMVSTLDIWGEFTEAVLNALSLLSIIVGVVVSLFASRKRSLAEHSMHTIFRYRFGGWLIVALEFQLAADIASTIVSPTTEHLIELGVIAFIRTFLNYFLNKELTEEKEALKVSTEKKKFNTLVWALDYAKNKGFNSSGFYCSDPRSADFTGFKFYGR